MSTKGKTIGLFFYSSCIYQNLGWKLCHQQGGHSGFCKYAIICCSIGDVPRALQSYCRHIDYNDYNYYKEYNDYSDFNDYNNYNDYRDSDLDWERFSELLTLWHSWLLLTNCETLIMTLSVSDLQSDSDLDSIRNSCDVWLEGRWHQNWAYTSPILFIQFGSSMFLINSTTL